MTHKQLTTRQQYSEALELIDKYHRQTFNNDIMNSGKVTSSKLVIHVINSYIRHIYRGSFKLPMTKSQ
jgi:hypothetical protein